MSGDLNTVMKIAGSGLKVQSKRLEVTAQNIANADSTGSTPGADPYRRKTITFESMLNRELGAEMVGVKKIGEDPSDFKLVYEPTHPAADAKGYVKYPNIETMIENLDAREAQRSYEANLRTIEVTKGMMRQTIDILQ